MCFRGNIRIMSAGRPRKVRFNCWKMADMLLPRTSSSSSPPPPPPPPLGATALREPWPPVLFASTGLYPELSFSILQSPTSSYFRQEILNPDQKFDLVLAGSSEGFGMQDVLMLHGRTDGRTDWLTDWQTQTDRQTDRQTLTAIGFTPSGSVKYVYVVLCVPPKY
jgi:hypothetical protein